MQPETDRKTNKLSIPQIFPHWKNGDTILDSYRVEDIISTGGMGHIYVTNHVLWKVKVAIKSPKGEILIKKNLYARIAREADAWTNLGLHPHIVYCYFVRAIEDVPHIFVEYVDGGNLRKWIEDGRCANIRIALDLAIQFCHGMAYAHSKGMIHRDIKPENILMTKDGILKITDFGIARWGKEDNSLEDCTLTDDMKTVGFIGTRAYASPEQLMDAHTVGPETDIFSFGVCLWEMLLGQRPYVLAIKELPLPDPKSFKPNLPDQFISLLTDLVAYDREARRKIGGFATLKDRLESIYQNIFNSPSTHHALETLDLKAGGFNNRAISYLELGKNEEAVSCWKKALKEDPQHLEATFNYGYYCWDKGALYKDILRTQMSNLKGTHEHNPEFWRILAWLCYEHGDIDALKEIQDSEHMVTDPAFLMLCGDLNNPTERWVRTLKGHSDSVWSVIFSPDGNYILSCSTDKTMRLWETATGKELRRFEGHSGDVRSVAFSPDGRYIISGSGEWRASEDNSIKLWEVATGRELRRFEGHSGGVSSVAFSPDGRYIISGSKDKTIRLWEINTGKELRRFEGHSNGIDSVVFSPDGRYVISGGYNNPIRLWEAATGRELRRFEGHGSGITSVAFSPDGRYLISGGWDNTARLWEVATGKELRRFEGHSYVVRSVAFSSDGRYIISGSGEWGASEDNSIRLWEVATGKELRRFEGHSGGVTSVAFSPDGRYILSGNHDKTIRLCHWRSLKRVPTGVDLYPVLSRIKPPGELFAESREVQSLLASATAYINHGSLREAYTVLRKIQLIRGYERNKDALDLITLCVLKKQGRRRDFRSGWHVTTFEGHGGGVTSIAFSPNGKYILSGSTDKTTRLWEVATGKELRRFEGHSGGVSSVAFSPDGRYIISGSEDKTIMLWETATGKELKCFEGHRSGVTSTAFSPDGRYIISGSGEWRASEDNSIRLWEVATGRELKQFEAHGDWILSVVFSPDGRYVLSGGNDNPIRLWGAATGRELRRFEGHGSGVTSVAFSPDGRYIISGGWDNTARLWEVATGKELRLFKGHSGWVSSVAFSPDGRYIISNSMSNTIMLSESLTGRKVMRFEGNDNYVNSVVFSPDGRYVLSASQANTIMLWEVDWEWEFNDDI